MSFMAGRKKSANMAGEIIVVSCDSIHIQRSRRRAAPAYPGDGSAVV